MTSRTDTHKTIAQPPLLRWIFLFYCLFILYGTFIPFHFTDDPAFIRSQWERFFTPPFINGVRQFSLPDVVSNLLLFIPFGLLRIGSRRSSKPAASALQAALTVGLLGALFGLSIEIGQTRSPGRTASMLDVFCNGIGAATGAVIGQLLMASLRGKLGALLTDIIEERASLLVLAFLIIAALANAFYPFHVTLDVSTVWQSFKQIKWPLFARGADRLWTDLLVQNILLFAAIGYLAVTNLRMPAAGLLAWLLCAALAGMIEGGKLFFAGRVPNLENFIVDCIGAALGTLLVRPAAESALCRRSWKTMLILLVLGVAAYSELAPFDWVAAGDLGRRIDQVEWLPFRAYYGADPQSALFDLATKLFIVGPLGYLLAIDACRKRTVAAAAGLACGAFLESLQILLQSRIPSTTDVILFGLAAWTGALMHERLLTFQGGATVAKTSPPYSRSEEKRQFEQ